MSQETVEERIGDALMELVVERGFDDVTVEMVVGRSGATMVEFELRYDDLEDCYVQVYRHRAARFDEMLWHAFEAEGSWRDSLRAAAYEAARFFRDNPRVVRFGAIEMFRAGPMAQAHRERQLQRFVDMIDLGRGELDDPESLNRTVAEGVVGSIYGALIRELGEGKGTRDAESFVPELMYTAVRPYLGHETALEELEIPAPPETDDPGWSRPYWS